MDLEKQVSSAVDISLLLINLNTIKVKFITLFTLKYGGEHQGSLLSEFLEYLVNEECQL